MSNIKKAQKIAISNLRACYGKHGIFAGLHHFKDYWARDSFFASLGSIKLKDYDIVKTNLELFLNHLSKQGQIPIRIGKTSKDIALSYLRLKPYNTKRRAIYNIDKSNRKPVDQNSLAVITAFEYINASKDINFLKENIEKFEKIIAWNFLQDYDNDLLIEEDEFCNWADSIKKKGKVLYTNVCHCHAINCLSKLYKKLDKNNQYLKYKKLYEEIKQKINYKFWSGEHYLDWIDIDLHYNYFSTDGNILAILWDVADKEKSKHIEEAAHIFDINDIPSQCVHPSYSKDLISTQTKIIGLNDYHNGLSWLWLGCINAMAKQKLGMKKEATLILNKIAEIIIKNNAVYEVYDNKGNPINRLIYKSEHPFAWSAGLFIYAIQA